MSQNLTDKEKSSIIKKRCACEVYFTGEKAHQVMDMFSDFLKDVAKELDVTVTTAHVRLFSD